MAPSSSSVRHRFGLSSCSREPRMESRTRDSTSEPILTVTMAVPPTTPFTSSSAHCASGCSCSGSRSRSAVAGSRSTSFAKSPRATRSVQEVNVMNNEYRLARRARLLVLEQLRRTNPQVAALSWSALDLLTVDAEHELAGLFGDVFQQGWDEREWHE